MMQMGRARERVHADVWAVLGQAVDAAGGKAVTQRKMLAFLINQLDTAATSSNVRSSTFKLLFAVQGNEVGCQPYESQNFTCCNSIYYMFLSVFLSGLVQAQQLNVVTRSEIRFCWENNEQSRRPPPPPFGDWYMATFNFLNVQAF
jgi:hypothetical protein